MRILNQVEADEGLVVAHTATRDASGLPRLCSNVWIEELSGTLEPISSPRHVRLTRCLEFAFAAHSDDLRFSRLDDGFPEPRVANRVFARPASVAVGASGPGMGFGENSTVGRRFLLPRLVGRLAGQPSLVLDASLKAAMQLGSATFGVRLSIVSLTHSDRALLRKVDSTVLAREYPASIVEAMLAHSAPWVRVEPFVEMTEKCASVEALLDVLASQMLPGRELVGQIEGRESDSEQDVLDLSSCLIEGPALPPMFFSLGALETTGVRLHYLNPPVSFPADGVLLGMADIAGRKSEVRVDLNTESLYMVGGTGAGKTSLMEHIARDFMQRRRGFAFLDPAGDVIESLMRNAGPHEDRIILIDPAESGHAVAGINPLALEEDSSPAAITRIVNDFISLFASFWNMDVVGGPGFESYFRMAMMLAMSAPYESPGNPSSRPSLKTLVAVLRDRNWRTLLLENVRTSVLGSDLAEEVESFFGTAHEAKGEQSFANWSGYVSSKLGRFTESPTLRAMLCCQHSTVNFRELIDDGSAIVLCDLSKGKLGAFEARMVGNLVVNEFFKAASSRVDIPVARRTPFTLICDEVHDYIGSAFEHHLAQGRKFGLNYVLGHQSTRQISDHSHQGKAMSDAIFSNVAQQVVFRVSAHDAHLFEETTAPHIDAAMLMSLPKYHAAGRVAHEPGRAFVFETRPPSPCVGALEGERALSRIRTRNRERHSAARLTGRPSSKTEKGTRQAWHAGPGRGRGLAAGRISLSGNGLSDTAFKELGAKLIALEKAHRSRALRAGARTLRPEPGHTYWTGNGSLVAVTGVSRGHNHLAIVLRGGHALPGVPGSLPGGAYLVNEDGEYRIEDFAAPFMDMSLIREARLPALSVLFEAEARHTEPLSWLENTDSLRSSLMIERDSLFLTASGSLVLVLAACNDKNERRAVVLAGGHGIESLHGECAGELYPVDVTGAYCLKDVMAKELPAVKIAAIAGMSLEKRIEESVWTETCADATLVEG